ncbi:MAG: hypothetical protein KUG78_00285 [Kangiellaceae bacterium]|nr:hypothetical protein [Kangiellaceae bacterium]
MSVLLFISDALSIFFLWLFVSAGLNKLNPQKFKYYVNLMTSYGWKNTNISGSLVMFVGLVEIAIGISILLPSTKHVAVISMVILLAIYIWNIEFQLYHGRKNLDCGCGGAAFNLKVSRHLVWRNLILILLASFCLNSGSVVDWSYWSFALLIGALSVIIYQSSEQLISNAQKLNTLRTS